MPPPIEEYGPLGSFVQMTQLQSRSLASGRGPSPLWKQMYLMLSCQNLMPCLNIHFPVICSPWISRIRILDVIGNMMLQNCLDFLQCYRSLLIAHLTLDIYVCAKWVHIKQPKLNLIVVATGEHEDSKASITSIGRDSARPATHVAAGCVRDRPELGGWKSTVKHGAVPLLFPSSF